MFWSKILSNIKNFTFRYFVLQVKIFKQLKHKNWWLSHWSRWTEIGCKNQQLDYQWPQQRCLRWPEHSHWWLQLSNLWHLLSEQFLWWLDWASVVGVAALATERLTPIARMIASITWPAALVTEMDCQHRPSKRQL